MYACDIDVIVCSIFTLIWRPNSNILRKNYADHMRKITAKSNIK